MTLVENCKVVVAAQPVDINGSGMTGDYVSLKDYNHATIILQAGVVGATANITVNKATDVSGTDATTMTFNHWYETKTGSGDALPQGTAASSVATGTTNNQLRVIEIDAAELGDYDCINVNISDPESSSFWSAVYVLSGARFKQATPPSAIVD